MIRVLVVDDHVLMAEGLIAAINATDDLRAVGVAVDAASAFDLAASTAPHVVLMDYSLGDDDGVATGVELKQRHPNLRVVMLTGHQNDAVIVRTVDAGLDGFLRKTATISEVTDAVRHAHAGEPVFSARDLRMVLRTARSPVDSPTTLTPREVEVLHLLARGESTAAIGSSLYVSQHTVRSHVRHILEKLDAHSKLEAVAIALRDGLVEIS